MEKDFKMFFGKILGEIYRIQKHINPEICKVRDSKIYGLLNGFENVINEEVNNYDFVSKEDLISLGKIMDDIRINNRTKNSNFKGYYEIEDELKRQGKNIDRATAITIIKYYLSENKFIDLVKKFDTENSPDEMRKINFEKDDI